MQTKITLLQIRSALNAVVKRLDDEKRHLDRYTRIS